MLRLRTSRLAPMSLYTLACDCSIQTLKQPPDMLSAQMYLALSNAGAAPACLPFSQPSPFSDQPWPFQDQSHHWQKEKRCTDAHHSCIIRVSRKAPYHCSIHARRTSAGATCKVLQVSAHVDFAASKHSLVGFALLRIASLASLCWVAGQTQPFASAS